MGVGIQGAVEKFRAGMNNLKKYKTVKDMEKDNP